MTKFFQIFLLFAFVTVPTLDIAFLDAQDASGHFVQDIQSDKAPAKSVESDILCNCHILHHGITADKVNATLFDAANLKAPAFVNLAADGQHPKPHLRPPSAHLS